MTRLFVHALAASVVALVFQPPPQKPQRPVFRADAHFVRVDAYPTKDDRIVEGLTVEDFELFEDGKPQKIDTFQFISFDSFTPDVERRDPSSQRESFDLAANPEYRVFVLYLDLHHVGLTGSHSLRRPLVDMLNRMLGPKDLFGVLTPRQFAKDLLLGQKTLAIEEQLERYWDWGVSGRRELDEADQHLSACRLDELIPRRQLDKTFADLEEIMELLGNIREQRSNIIFFSDGLLLPGPDQALLARNQPRGPTPIGITEAGKLTMGGTARGRLNSLGCESELLRLAHMDFQQRYRDLVKTARRANVVFYPVAPSGLLAPSSVAGMRAATSMTDSLRTLANETNGVAVVNTNDIGSGLRRIASDLSASYVLGYYTTNTTWDGAVRQIAVRLKSTGKTIRARREYRAPSEAEMATLRAATATSAPPPPSPVETALGALARLRPSATVNSYGRGLHNELTIVTEIRAAEIEAGRWKAGADVDVIVSANSQTIATGRGRIEPGARASVVRIPVSRSAGPWQALVRVRGESEHTEELTIAPGGARALGTPLVFRAAPAETSPLRPVATFQFRRTERIHVEWPILTPLDRREAALMDRAGTTLAVPVVLSEKAVDGAPVLAADLNLAALTAGDYVVAVTAVAGPTAARQFIAIRVVR